MENGPSADDQELLATYAGEFSDGTPRGWVIEESGDYWEFTFPNLAKFNSKELTDAEIWGATPDSDANTTVLWRNSLAYIPRLLKIKSGVAEVAIAEQIIQSFLNWFENISATDMTALKSGSQDHQSALRIRTLLWILSFLHGENRAEEFSTFSSLYSRLLVIENRLLNEFDLYQPNNHGIMLGIAHLHAETLFPNPLVTSDARQWVDRLYTTLGQIIDEDGIASENTPIYQVFYVMLLEDIVSFVNWSGRFTGKARLFQMLLRSAQIGVRRQLLPSGAVPPLGDSPGGMQHRFKPMFGTLWSPNNGIAILNLENEHLSFVAGFRSVIHKQLDELSIAWWKNGHFIFRDAGLLSYDANDPIAVSMRGPKGHSLPIYSQFDAWTTKNSISYGKNSSRLRGKLESRKSAAGITEFAALLSYDDNPIVRRQVVLIHDETMTTTDTFIAPRYGVPIVRFVLDPSIEATRREDGSVMLTGPQLSLSANFTTSISGTKAKVEIGETHIALEHLRSVKTQELLVSLPDCKQNVEITSSFVKNNR